MATIPSCGLQCSKVPQAIAVIRGFWVSHLTVISLAGIMKTGKQYSQSELTSIGTEEGRENQARGVAQGGKAVGETPSHCWYL